ncbi:GRAM domain-containing protein 2A isoform X3 [Sciurus carolinensis]|uniref:GRAM domain-containing protein 2A isoform X3 n=1 Tax=Sciurus carolinensis TaxID=30640 RepID=UPI001FB39D92|nr:GRAM domain-containing protein 2A isoform X3 [Sciurus carolinensis]
MPERPRGGGRADEGGLKKDGGRPPPSAPLRKTPCGNQKGNAQSHHLSVQPTNAWKDSISEEPCILHGDTRQGSGTPRIQSVLARKLEGRRDKEVWPGRVCSCALQRDLLLQGRLYISPNWLCFHASLFGKDIKVVIPVVSVQMIKKHKMARLLPNGLAITTNTSQKYVFVSLLSRDNVYDLLRRVCTHLQPSSKKSLSVRKFPEEPECESPEVLIPEMKWRKVCPASRSLSLPDNIPYIPQASMDCTDSFFPSRKPPGSESAACEDRELEEEPTSDQELRLWDSRLLKVVFLLICFLVMSSSYLAFRISQLEQRLCSLNWDAPVPGHRETMLLAPVHFLPGPC